MDGVWLGIDSGAWMGFTLLALVIALCIAGALKERRDARRPFDQERQ